MRLSSTSIGPTLGEHDAGALEAPGIGHDADGHDDQVAGQVLARLQADGTRSTAFATNDFLDVDSGADVDALVAHVLGDERGLRGVQGQRKVPAVADQEGHVKPAVLKDLGGLDADEAAADHDGPATALRLAIKAFEIAQGDEAVHAWPLRSWPGGGPSLRSQRQQQFLVGEAGAILEHELLAPGRHAGHTLSDAVETHSLDRGRDRMARCPGGWSGQRRRTSAPDARRSGRILRRRPLSVPLTPDSAGRALLPSLRPRSRR